MSDGTDKKNDPQAEDAEIVEAEVVIETVAAEPAAAMKTVAASEDKKNSKKLASNHLKLSKINFIQLTRAKKSVFIKECA